MNEDIVSSDNVDQNEDEHNEMNDGLDDDESSDSDSDRCGMRGMIAGAVVLR